jgi:hypothetical protein
MDMTSVPICPMWPGDAVVLIVAVVLPLAQPRRCASISALVAVVPEYSAAIQLKPYSVSVPLPLAGHEATVKVTVRPDTLAMA